MGRNTSIFIVLSITPLAGNDYLTETTSIGKILNGKKCRELEAEDLEIARDFLFIDLIENQVKRKIYRQYFVVTIK